MEDTYELNIFAQYIYYSQGEDLKFWWGKRHCLKKSSLVYRMD